MNTLALNIVGGAENGGAGTVYFDESQSSLHYIKVNNHGRLTRVYRKNDNKEYDPSISGSLEYSHIRSHQLNL